MLSRHDAALRLLPTSSKRVTGVAKGDRLIAVDLRPATGGLYSLSRFGQLYRIDAKTAVATAVGAPIALQGKAIGFDFNPTVDRIRVVTDAGQLSTIGRLGLNISSVNGFDITDTAGTGAYNPRDYRAVAVVQAHGVSCWSASTSRPAVPEWYLRCSLTRSA